MIKDVLWENFSDFVPADRVEIAARKLLPKLSHLHKQFDPIGVEPCLAKEMELSAVDEDRLREDIIELLMKVITNDYGI